MYMYCPVNHIIRLQFLTVMMVVRPDILPESRHPVLSSLALKEQYRVHSTV